MHYPLIGLRATATLVEPVSQKFDDIFYISIFESQLVCESSCVWAPSQSYQSIEKCRTHRALCGRPSTGTCLPSPQSRRFVVCSAVVKSRQDYSATPARNSAILSRTVANHAELNELYISMMRRGRSTRLRGTRRLGGTLGFGRGTSTNQHKIEQPICDARLHPHCSPAMRR